jgi:hypothetical protein
VSNGDSPVDRGSIAHRVDAKSKQNRVSCLLRTAYF